MITTLELCRVKPAVKVVNGGHILIMGGRSNFSSCGVCLVKDADKKPMHKVLDKHTKFISTCEPARFGSNLVVSLVHREYEGPLLI